MGWYSYFPYLFLNSFIDLKYVKREKGKEMRKSANTIIPDKSSPNTSPDKINSAATVKAATKVAIITLIVGNPIKSPISVAKKAEK